MEEKVGGRIGWRKKKEDRNWRMSGGERGTRPSDASGNDGRLDSGDFIRVPPERARG